MCPEFAMGPDKKSGPDKFDSPCMRGRNEYLDETAGPSNVTSSVPGSFLATSDFWLSVVSLFSSLPLVDAASVSKLKVMTPLGTLRLAGISLDPLPWAEISTSEGNDKAADAEFLSPDTSCNKQRPRETINHISRRW